VKVFLPTLALVLLLVTFTRGQQACDHTSDSEERFSWMRILPPIDVLFFDNLTIDFRTGLVVHAHGLNVDSATRYADNFAKDYRKGKWWVIYCAKPTGRIVDGKPEICNHVYVISAVAPGQIQKPGASRQR
jgi:hypothetical protein